MLFNFGVCVYCLRLSSHGFHSNPVLPIFKVNTQLLQRLSGLVQTTMDTKDDAKETMDPDSKNNRAASSRDPMK